MPFKPVSSINSGVSFNSAVSGNFKALYDKILHDKYLKQESRKGSRTFAPSSFRCDRASFFRLRGADPDPVLSVNMQLEYSAVLGTASHKEIQENLKNSLGDQWVDAVDYLNSKQLSHTYKINHHGELETLIEFTCPPVKFSCDGILKIGQKYYLLEIKTSEHQSFSKLSEPKPQHVDQVQCYCALMEFDNALVFYQDRLYGDTKCFEVSVPDYVKSSIFERMEKVQEYAKNNIAPPRLPRGDAWCTYCKYKKRCDTWG